MAVCACAAAYKHAKCACGCACARTRVFACVYGGASSCASNSVWLRCVCMLPAYSCMHCSLSKHRRGQRHQFWVKNSFCTWNVKQLSTGGCSRGKQFVSHCHPQFRRKWPKGPRSSKIDVDENMQYNNKNPRGLKAERGLSTSKSWFLPQLCETCNPRDILSARQYVRIRYIPRENMEKGNFFFRHFYLRGQSRSLLLGWDNGTPHTNI